MAEIEDLLSELFQEKGAGAFLFVGSGFSRRYLGLEDWKGLLARFCTTERPIEYYVSSSNGDLPTAARLLAEDFHATWWAAEAYKSSVEKNKSLVRDRTSALRLEICNYLSSLDQTIALKSDYAAEVELLSSLNVDGIITTNWDPFIEQLFPDYKVYVGQKELLFANPQQIAEIYKIHGSCDAPESLVLTDSDYSEFHEKNAYLAAKLITLFVEHPIVFLGYSIADPNISAMLRSISLCIGHGNLEKLRRNLIFVTRPAASDADSISDTYMTIDGVQIPLVLVSTNDFTQVYRALETTKRKIPARVLRYCKEQLYELVQSSDPEKKLCVVDIDDIERTGDVEFLVGVGVAKEQVSREAVSSQGYVSIELHDLIHDLLHEDRGFDAGQILEHVIRSAGRNTPNCPVYKYLREAGIDSVSAYKTSGLALDKWVSRDLREYKSTKTYSAPYRKHHRGKSVSEIISDCTPENAAAFIPFVPPEKIDLDALRNFLIANEAKVQPGASNYASSFRKLASLYDRLRWGW